MNTSKIATFNAGYDIIEVIEVPSGYYVRGKNGNRYVTWYTKNGSDFYFGNYFSSSKAKLLSIRDLYDRVRYEYQANVDRLDDLIENAVEEI